MHPLNQLKLILAWLLGLALLMPNFALAHHVPGHQAEANVSGPSQPVNASQAAAAVIVVLAQPRQAPFLNPPAGFGSCGMEIFGPAGDLLQNALALNLNQPASCFNLRLTDLRPQAKLGLAEPWPDWPKVLPPAAPFSQIWNQLSLAAPGKPFLPLAPLPAVWAAFAAAAMGGAQVLKKLRQTRRSDWRWLKFGQPGILRC